MNDARRRLTVIDDAIDARSRATEADHPYWPCADGCDLCCRTLPHLPTMTEPEWERLREAIAALSSDVQSDVRTRIDTARESRPGAVVCPLLDVAVGRCRVYAARPVPCRTYGFYVERDGGMHCARVTERLVEHDATDGVVWGNGEAIAREVATLGELRPLDEWMRRDDR